MFSRNLYHFHKRTLYQEYMYMYFTHSTTIILYIEKENQYQFFHAFGVEVHHTFPKDYTAI